MRRLEEEPVDTGATPSRFTTKRKIALGLGGVAALGIVGGVVLGKAAKTKEDDAFSLCPNPTTPCADAMRADGLIDDARSKALTANIAFGVAGAAAIGAAVLWFTGAPATTETSVAIVPAAHSATFAVSGRVLMKRLVLLALLASACHIGDVTFTPLGGGDVDDPTGTRRQARYDALPGPVPQSRGFAAAEGAGILSSTRRPMASSPRLKGAR